MPIHVGAEIRRMEEEEFKARVYEVMRHVAIRIHAPCRNSVTPHIVPISKVFSTTPASAPFNGSTLLSPKSGSRRVRAHINERLGSPASVHDCSRVGCDRLLAH